MKHPNHTEIKILDLAQFYTQTKGFNAFSFQDIQNEIGVNAPIIHHYFPTKTDLTFKVTQRCLEQFHEMIKSISKKHHCGLKRIDELVKFHVNTFTQEKSCLFAMIATEKNSLPESVSSLVEEFFALNLEWITDSVELAIKQNKVNPSIIARDFGAKFLAIMHGGMIMAPLRKSSSKSLSQLFQKSIDQISL